MKLIALMKKEFHRFFHDPRLIVTMLLPGILLYVIYSIMGTAMYAEKEPQAYKVYVGGSSAAVSVIETAIAATGDTVEWLPLEDEEAARAEVERGEAAAVLLFSENFDEFPQDSSVRIVYNGAEEKSSNFYAIAGAALESYGMRFSVIPESVKSDEEIGRTLFAGFLPFLIVTLIFSTCMGVTIESVAGEKERGTLSTILATSAPRFQIALGKVIPLSCIASIGAASSFLGVALSMPKLMGVSLGAFGGYPVWSYLLIFLLILSLVPLIVASITTVSTLSRSVKEASAYTSVIMILFMLLSIVSAFVPTMGDWVVCIPILNAVGAMGSLFAGQIPVWQSLVSVGLNFVYSALLVLLMTKFLSSERVMFGK